MYLLDTNALIFTLTAPEKLADAAYDIIINTDNTLYVSVASLWEIVIKQSIGKLEIDKTINEIATECLREDIYFLDIKPTHLMTLRTLPFIHRDPFDRLYIAQAKTEDMTIITSDTIIPQYDVKTLWK